MQWSTYLAKGVTHEKPSYAFLLLKEHPYGRAMLRELLSEGKQYTVASLRSPWLYLFDKTHKELIELQSSFLYIIVCLQDLFLPLSFLKFQQLLMRVSSAHDRHHYHK
jgi:hypothetical protein